MIVVNQSRALSPRVFYRLYVLALNLIETVQDAYERRKTHRALEALSDHELADVGLTRHMIYKL